MGKTIIMPMKTRALKLRETIEYAEENNFNPELIEKYKVQLAGIEEVLREDKEKQKERRARSREVLD